jgi:glycosyltransferase involved in cell wall biosynthesis
LSFGTSRFDSASESPDITIFSPMGRDGGSAHGGITRVVVNLAGAFPGMGKRVELLTFSPHDPLCRLGLSDPLITGFNFPPGSRLVHLFRLRSYLLWRRPGVLVAAGMRPNLIAAQCKRYFKPDCPVFLSVHNALAPALNELGQRRCRQRLRVLRALYPVADGIICVSAGIADELAALLPLNREQLMVIHNPVLTEDALKTQVDKSPHPWFEPGQPRVILGAGRLTNQKDFPTLIRAFAIVREQQECRLMILGEGGERDLLGRLVRDLGLEGDVLLPGFVQDPMGFMAKSAVFVLSSAWEGFGNVLVEAMAAGIPVVSTDCPSGPREILLDGELGPLVPVGDPSALAVEIQRTLEAPVDSSLLRRRATDFTNIRITDRYLECLFPQDDIGYSDG